MIPANRYRTPVQKFTTRNGECSSFDAESEKNINRSAQERADSFARFEIGEHVLVTLGLTHAAKLRAPDKIISNAIVLAVTETKYCLVYRVMDTGGLGEMRVDASRLRRVKPAGTETPAISINPPD